MHDDLYFIPILTAAAAQPQPAAAFAQAFEQIRVLGGQERYRRGFEQFKLFMAAASSAGTGRSAPPDEHAAVEDLILDLETGAFDDSAYRAAMKLIESQPAWKEQFEKLHAQLREVLAADAEIELVLTRDQHRLASIPFGTRALRRIINDIVPGHLRLATSSGWVIWEQQLGAADLLWHAGPKARALPLAADTGHKPRRPDRRIRLLAGRLILDIFRGLESGRIELELKA